MGIEYPIEVNEIKFDYKMPFDCYCMDKNNIGQLVKIRPCAEEYKDQTYLGILLGELPIGIYTQKKKDEIKELMFSYNPAIYVFELKKIIFGLESWWGKIQSVDEINDISDEDISNIWYVKILKEVEKQKEGTPEKRNFQKSLGYLLKAKEFDPDRPEAKWGIATTYHGLGDIEQEKGNTKEAAAHQDRSIQAYKELIEEYPDNYQFKFELCLVYLQVGFGSDADKLFNSIFAETDKYDFFLKNLAELYFKAGMIEEAKVAIQLYIEKFPFDPRGKKLYDEINYPKEPTLKEGV